MLRVQEVVDRHFTPRDIHRTRILDCGCGFKRPFDLTHEAEWHGIDISPEQLDRNGYLDYKILGDIQGYDEFEDCFDIVVSIDVLEHLPRPQQAMANIIRAAAPGGLIIVKIPNILSVKGLVTKFTPFQVHEFVYQRFYDVNTTPFPTYHRLSNRRGALTNLARQHGCEVLEIQLYTSRTRQRITHFNYWISKLTSKLTWGWFGESEMLLVFRKSDPTPTQDPVNQRAG
jgi:SAM-dependent methyltransferase